MMKVVFFVFILGVMADTGKIEVDSMIITLICPKNSSHWKSQLIDKMNHSSTQFSFTYEGDKKGVLYYCLYDKNEIYGFYFKGKVCKDCYELKGMTLLTIISGDLLVTAGVILFAYLRAQRKSEPPSAAANHQSTSREPEPNYEDLSPRTRDNATYAGVHRTG